VIHLKLGNVIHSKSEILQCIKLSHYFWR